MHTSSLADAPASGYRVDRIECGDSEVDRLMDGGGGFASFGHFARTVATVQSKGHRGELSESDGNIQRRWIDAQVRYRNWVSHYIDKSTRRAISSPDGMFENSDPDGGALIPTEFVREVWDKSRFVDSPFKRAKTVFVRSNAGVMPAIAETSRVDGSRWGGVQAYWEGEAQQGTKLHGTLVDSQYHLKKLMVLIPASDELVEDGGGLFDEYITSTAAKELNFQINRTMVAGSGVGMLLGVMSPASPGSILVAKDTNQAAQTISATNIQNVWTQTHGPSRANGVWWANEEFEPDSVALTTTPMTGWSVPVDAPTLKGRPVLPLEWCPQLGTAGDLFFGDFSQYLLILQGLGSKMMMSAHLKFDYFESFFKFLYRADGQSLWPAPLTSLYGTKVKSPFVGISQR